jgi:hypothetical protein
MRFLSGIIVGCLLTVGVAYVHDLSQPASPTTVVTDEGAEGRMVNWAVVNHSLHGVNGWMQTQWAWISGRLNHAG